MKKLDDSQYQGCRRRSLGDPEAEHALRESGLELRELRIDGGRQSGESGLHLRTQLGNALFELCVQLDHSLFELSVEASIIQLVELAQITAVRAIHHVEPLHELNGDKA